MIIPIRCFTCSKVLGNKYDYFVKKVIERKKKLNQDPTKISVINLNSKDLSYSIEGEVLNRMKMRLI